jgi:hypothetical protein
MSTCRRLACLALVGGLLGAAVASRAVSDEPRAKTEKEKDADHRGEAAAQLALAQTLAAHGRRTHSPLELVTAAEILRHLGAPVQELKIEPKVEGKAGEGPAKAEPLMSPTEEADILLADAKSMAVKQAKEGKLSEAGAAAIEALARDVQKIEKTRGAFGGPKRRSGFLYPGQTHTFNIDFDGWSMGRVFVNSEGRSPLRVTVTNLDGFMRGEDGGWNPSVAWMPPRQRGGVFVIRVQNIGDYGTPYRLVTN